LKAKPPSIVEMFLAESQKLLGKEHLPHIVKCLEQLSDEEIWWRPNSASNSAGNLVLHLSGNIRQWIISNLGEKPDVRDRDSEFAERGVVSRQALISRIEETVQEACKVLARLPEEKLTRKYVIQGLHTTGLEAIYHVVEHFSHHTGQIVYITKLKLGQDLRFTNLPLLKAKKKSGA